MKRDTLAYWAGFFDGEGHIELDYRNPYGSYVFQVWIDQWTKTPDALFGELLDNFGGRLILQRNSPNNFRWFISGENGKQFLEALFPYLRRKKRLAKLGIEMQRRMQRGHGGKRVRLQESEILTRDDILVEYFSLIEGNKPKRTLKLGQYILLEGRRPE